MEGAPEQNKNRSAGLFGCVDLLHDGGRAYAPMEKRHIDWTQLSRSRDQGSMIPVSPARRESALRLVSTLPTQARYCPYVSREVLQGTHVKRIVDISLSNQSYSSTWQFPDREPVHARGPQRRRDGFCARRRTVESRDDRNDVRVSRREWRQEVEPQRRRTSRFGRQTERGWRARPMSPARNEAVELLSRLHVPIMCVGCRMLRNAAVVSSHERADRGDSRRQNRARTQLRAPRPRRGNAVEVAKARHHGARSGVTINCNERGGGDTGRFRLRKLT